eukprot:g7971.t1
MAKGEMDVGPAKSESEKGNDAAIVVDPGKPELEVGDDNKGANKHKDDQEEADQNDNQAWWWTSSAKKKKKKKQNKAWSDNQQEAQQEEQKEDTAIQEGKDKAAAEKGDKAAVEKGVPVLKPLADADGSPDEVAQAEEELDRLYRELNRRMEGVSGSI